MGLFSADGLLYKYISRFWDMVVLSFLWIVFSLPIITIGASTVAAYSVTLKMVDDEEGYTVRSFVKAFKENLKQGIILGLITIVSFYMVYLDIILFNAIKSKPVPLLIIGIIAGVYYTASLLYAFPLAARYHNSVLELMRNSRHICSSYFLRTAIMLVLVILLILAASWNATTIIFGILIGPAFIIFTIAAFSKRIFQKIEKDQE